MLHAVERLLSQLEERDARFAIVPERVEAQPRARRLQGRVGIRRHLERVPQLDVYKRQGRIRQRSPPEIIRERITLCRAARVKSIPQVCLLYTSRIGVYERQRQQKRADDEEHDDRVAVSYTHLPSA